ncbi:hypothetical protein [Methanothrix soehngenii]|uniref:hypothetical protein n=1 Tax=Methanothrix soehngenii TaxID=2223 RepID=UPI002FD9A6D6
MSVDTDFVIGTPDANFCQQCDLVLSNVGGRFEGAISAVGQTGGTTQRGINGDISGLSQIVVILRSYEYSNAASLKDPQVYTVIVFAGYAQKVDYSYTTVKISGGTADIFAEGYLHKDIHIHGGEDAGPAIAEALRQFRIPIGKIQLIDIKRREWTHLGATSGKGLLDFASNHMGEDQWMDERGKLNILPPYVEYVNPTYTGRMKMPTNSESAVGLCNRVEVRGAGFLPPTDPGSANLGDDPPFYRTTEADLAEALALDVGGGVEEATKQLENFGWIEAPVYYFPELSTWEECRERAKRLLARYQTYWRRTVPTVVGRAPDLGSGITYSYPRTLGEIGNFSRVTVGPFSGRVVRVKTHFSSKAGWYSDVEIHPFSVNEAYVEKYYESIALNTLEEE